MKKLLLTLTSVILVAGVLSLSSCKKEDTTAPTLSVTGGNSQSQSLPSTAGNGSWTNPTATATDDEDGDISSSITVSGTVDPDTKGTYVLTYSVSDAAGNTASETVTVSIINDAEYLAGTHSVIDTCGTQVYTYSQTITTSTDVNNKIHFNKFADYSDNTTIYATVSGSTITLPQQTGVDIGTLNEDHQFQGNGTITGDDFHLNYTDYNMDNLQTASCSAHFTHQ
ncbi:MAG TPA: immunoglobulin-like domain-containing protein [Bacteroidia bacterium]|nr:immunoglobulin-like domain-containing protein [Bacteroidia bacterium]